MPDALDLLKTRRSIPGAFLGEPGPSAEELRDILTIGARVPDHGKLVPWRFVIIAGDERLQAGDAVAQLYRRKEPDAVPAKIDEQRDRIAKPPLTMIVVSRTAPHPKIPEWEQFLSAGNVAMNLVLASHALGYAAQWVTGFAAYDAEAAALLGVAANERIVALIHVGTPSAPPSERPRPDIDDITTRWQPARSW